MSDVSHTLEEDHTLNALQNEVLREVIGGIKMFIMASLFVHFTRYYDDKIQE
jgi:hypothetical protein